MKSIKKNNNKKKSLILFVLFTNTNILCTLANLKGKTLIWTTAGLNKTKGAKKVTLSIIFTTIKTLYTYSKIKGNLSIHIKISGTNKNKSVFIKYLRVVGFNILSIQEKLLLSFAGCKNIKLRRL